MRGRWLGLVCVLSACSTHPPDEPIPSRSEEPVEQPAPPEPPTSEPEPEPAEVVQPPARELSKLEHNAARFAPADR